MPCLAMFGGHQRPPAVSRQTTQRGGVGLCVPAPPLHLDVDPYRTIAPTSGFTCPIRSSVIGRRSPPS